MTKASLQFGVALLGFGLLASIVVRTGPQTVWSQIHKVGAGLLVIIALGGVAQLIKTWAWRLTLACDLSALSWSRSFGVCLASEALGQLGFGGKAVGEGVRVALVKPVVPLPNAIAAGAIDGALHLTSSAAVMLSGIVATLLFASLSGKWRVFALIFGIALVSAFIVAIVAYANGWELVGHAARLLQRIPPLHGWVAGQLPLIDSSERNLLSFVREAPTAFWAALLLNVLWQVLAVSEVYVILRFMGTHMALFGAFVMEGLTKVINLVGALNPGNIGTYEGGNMLMTKLFGVSATVGLTLALCRRARALFWSAVGAICLVLITAPKQQEIDVVDQDPEPGLV